MSRIAIAFLLTFALLCTTSCTKDVEYVAPDSSYGLIYNQIFAPSCALSGCHANSGKKKNLTEAVHPLLAGETAYGGLINGLAYNTQAANAGLKIVIPNDPDNSFLYQKIIFDSSAYQFGAAMPSGGLVLTANQITFVRQWIAAGAPLDGHVADRSLMQ